MIVITSTLTLYNALVRAQWHEILLFRYYDYFVQKDLCILQNVNISTTSMLVCRDISQLKSADHERGSLLFFSTLVGR